MSDELIDDFFHIEFPAWTVADQAQYEKTRNLMRCIPRTETSEHGSFFPLFTDKDLATQFIKELPLPGKVTVTLKNLHALSVILETLQPLGCKYVGVDVSMKPTIRGRFYPTQELIDAIKSQPHG